MFCRNNIAIPAICFEQLILFPAQSSNPGSYLTTQTHSDSLASVRTESYSQQGLDLFPQEITTVQNQKLLHHTIIPICFRGVTFSSTQTYTGMKLCLQVDTQFSRVKLHHFHAQTLLSLLVWLSHHFILPALVHRCTCACVLVFHGECWKLLIAEAASLADNIYSLQPFTHDGITANLHTLA